MKLAFTPPEISPSILELLRPWSFSVTNVEDADVVIARSKLPDAAAKAIIIPNDSPEFDSLVKSMNFSVPLRERSRQVHVSINEELVLQIIAETFFSYDVSENLGYALSVNESVSLLKIDVEAEFHRILNETFNAKPSIRYQLFTRLPIPYTKAPKRLRDIMMTHKSNGSNLNYSDKLPLDALRFALVKTIEKITGKKMKSALNGEKKTSCLITHDVDTREGLDRSLHIKKMEEKYDVASAWFVPSHHFALEPNVLGNLANHGEIGAHDTKHDGKIAGLHGSKLVARFQNAKRTLEEAGKCPIMGFRAPLLQHTFGILDALGHAGYLYDSSAPTYEPNHPRTMSPHGFGTVFPTKVYGMLEIPLTVIQDHQLLYTLGMKPIELMTLWKETFALIKVLGGCCVTLSHPEYRLFDPENLSLYEEFLNTIAGSQESVAITPTQLANEVVLKSVA